MLRIDDSSLILGNIYGNCNTVQNRNILEDVKENVLQPKERYVTENVLIGGDWNMVQDEWIERPPANLQALILTKIMVNFCNTLCLHYPWREKHTNHRQFSWFKPDASIKSRIDYWLVADTMLSQISIVKYPLHHLLYCFISSTRIAVCQKKRILEIQCQSSKI